MKSAVGFYISDELAREAYPEWFSAIGMGDYAKRVRRYTALSHILPRWAMKRLSPDYFTKPAEGYIPDARGINKAAILATIPAIEKTFGCDRKFRGWFADCFEDIRWAAIRPVSNSVGLREAIGHAVAQGRKVKSGFLVLSAEGNDYRPKDILIWNGKSGGWISLNRSKARFFARHKQELMPCSNDSLWAMSFDRHGVYIKVATYDWNDYILISTDGCNLHCYPLREEDFDWHGKPLRDDSLPWSDYSAAEQFGKNLWTARDAGISIRYDRHRHTAEYYIAEAGIWVGNDVRLSLYIASIESEYKPTFLTATVIKYELDPAEFPNLFLRRADSSVEPFRSVTVDTDVLAEDPVQVLDGLRELYGKQYETDPTARYYIEKDEEEGLFYFDEITYLHSYPGLTVND